MRKNFIFNTDSYKTSHFLQYPPGTTHVSSHIEPEPGIYKTSPEDELGSQKNILETVYQNGKLIREFSFDEVRENASR